MKNLKEFIVLVREVWVQPVKIKALNKEEAREKVADGDGTSIKGELEYSHTQDPDTWSIKEKT